MVLAASKLRPSEALTWKWFEMAALLGIDCEGCPQAVDEKQMYKPTSQSVSLTRAPRIAEENETEIPPH